MINLSKNNEFHINRLFKELKIYNKDDLKERAKQLKVKAEKL